MKIKGKIVSVLHADHKAKYAIVKVEEDSSKIILTCRGTIIRPETGQIVSLQGDMVVDEIYGDCLNITKCQLDTKISYSRLLRILKKFPGIGDAKAKKILSTLGDTAYQQILEDYTILDTIPGLHVTQTENFQHFLERTVLIENILNWCSMLITQDDIELLHSGLPLTSLRMVERSPYLLVLFTKISFTNLDAVMNPTVLEKEFDTQTQKDRAIARLYGVIENHMATKDALMPSNRILAAMNRNIKYQTFTKEDLEEALTWLIKNNYVVESKPRLYGISSYLNAIDRIKKYFTSKDIFVENPLTDKEIEEEVNQCMTLLSTTDYKAYLDASQRAAVGSINYKIAVITGPPGSGKSFVIRTIRHIVEKRWGYKVLLLSPTGRAASRIRGITIHRALAFQGSTPTRNEHDPLDSDLVIVDEASMVDTLLFQQLLCALKPTATLLLVGDNDQLPPVTYGKPFFDCINAFEEASLSNVFKLTTNHRQNLIGADIVTASQAVLAGVDRRLFEIARSSEAFKIIGSTNLDKIIYSRVLSVYTRALKEGRQSFLELVKNTLLLTASNYYQIRLNEMIRVDVLGLGKGYSFFQDERVICTENSYYHKIFNGEMGFITNIGIDFVEVLFDGHEEPVVFDYDAAKILEPGYAITIHKSQGSEAKNAVILIDTKSILYGQWNRKMLYTAISRGIERSILLCELSENSDKKPHPLKMVFKQTAQKVGLVYAALEPTLVKPVLT